MIEADVIRKALEAHGIRQYEFWDSEYVIVGNEDLPELGVTHSKYIDAINIYDEIVSKYMVSYKSEVFDCDDFARLLKVAFALAGINSCMIAVGKLWYKDELIGAHAFNLLPWAVTRDLSMISLLLIEPQLFPYGGAEFLPPKSNAVEMGDFKYEVLYVEV